MKDLSLHVMDILQNSITASADLIEFTIEEDKINDTYIMIFKDNGCGMAPEMAKAVVDPFVTSRTTRKVGLGIPLLLQNAERTGGYIELKSELGKGTVLKAVFGHENFDRPPLGDISGTIIMTASSNTDIEFIYTHKTDLGEYIFDTREIKEALDEVDISSPAIMRYLQEMIDENLDEIKIER